MFGHLNDRKRAYKPKLDLKTHLLSEHHGVVWINLTNTFLPNDKQPMRYKPDVWICIILNDWFQIRHYIWRNIKTKHNNNQTDMKSFGFRQKMRASKQKKWGREIERNRASCLGIHLNSLQAMKWFQAMPYDLNQRRYSIKLSLFYCHMPRVEGIQQTPSFCLHQDLMESSTTQIHKRGSGFPDLKDIVQWILFLNWCAMLTFKLLDVFCIVLNCC